MLQRSLLICGVAAVGLVGVLLGDATTLTADAPLLGPVSVSSRLALMVATVLAVFLAGFDRQRGQLVARIEAGLAPALLTLGFFMAGQAIAPDVPIRLPISALVGALMALLLAQSQAAERSWTGTASVYVVEAVLYVAALAMFTGIHGLRLPALVGVPAMGVAALVLAKLIRKDLLTALVVGLVVAEASWPLRYWPVSSLIAGLVLLLVFYVATGLLAPAKIGGASRAAVAYAIVGAMALAVIVAAVLRL